MSRHLPFRVPRDGAPHNPVLTTVTFDREIVACSSVGAFSVTLRAAWRWPRNALDARPWAVAIKEEVLARRMPPWPAERGDASQATTVVSLSASSIS